MADETKERRILGIKFFIGSVENSFDLMMKGGLLAYHLLRFLKICQPTRVTVRRFLIQIW